MVKRDAGFFDRDYEVYLSDGTNVEFVRKGEWDKVDCRMRTVPSDIVPNEIARYVQTAYPREKIVKIDRKRYGYKVELSNDLELKFNRSGMLVDMNY